MNDFVDFQFERMMVCLYRSFLASLTLIVVASDNRIRLESDTWSAREGSLESCDSFSKNWVNEKDSLLKKRILAGIHLEWNAISLHLQWFLIPSKSNSYRLPKSSWFLDWFIHMHVWKSSSLKYCWHESFTDEQTAEPKKASIVKRSVTVSRFIKSTQ